MKIFSLTLKKHSSFQHVMVVLLGKALSYFVVSLKEMLSKRFLAVFGIYLVDAVFQAFMMGGINPLHIGGFCFVHYLFLLLMYVVPECPILLSPIDRKQPTYIFF